MSLQTEQSLSAGCIPNRRVVLPIVAGQNLLAIRRKRDRPDPKIAFSESEQLLSAGRIPNLGRALLSAGDDAPAVRRKSYRRDQVAVLTERDQWLTARHVPNSGRT